jgi:branched-chain amino acid transport system substrate-binding protein
MGTDILHGVQLAIEEWNEKGGVLGKKVELVIGDDRRDPKEAVSVAQKLINDGVVAVIGHFNSSCSIPASTHYAEQGVIQISPASTNPGLTLQKDPQTGAFTGPRFRTVFRTCGRDDQQGKAQADFVSNVLKETRVAVLHDKTTYGQGLADEFKKNLGPSVQAVAYEGVVQGDKDFSAVLTRIKAQHPALVMFGGIYPEGGLLVKQMRELGIDAKFLSGDGVIDPEFIRIGGRATEGAFLSFGVLGPSGEAAVPMASVQNFAQAYRARFGEVGPYSIYAYDAVNVLLTAMQEAKSAEGAKVAEVLHQIDFPGASGQVKFDAGGDRIAFPYMMWVVRDGKFVPYRTEEAEPSP